MGLDVDGYQVQQPQVVAELFVAANPFIVINQIPTTIKNRLAPIDLYGTAEKTAISSGRRTCCTACNTVSALASDRSERNARPGRPAALSADSFLKTSDPKVQHMIVRQRTGIDAGGGEDTCIAGIHAVIEYRQGVAPRPIDIYRSGNRSIEFLRQRYITTGVADIVLTQLGFTRIGQYLVQPRPVMTSPARNRVIVWRVLPTPSSLRPASCTALRRTTELRSAERRRSGE